MPATPKSSLRSEKPHFLGFRLKSKKQQQAAFAWIVTVFTLSIAFFAAKGFSNYLQALGSHWLALMSGAVSVAITFWERARRTIARFTFFSIAGLCVFWAGFQAWQQEHSRADLTVPHLQIVRQAVYAMPDGKRDSLLVVLMHIKNLGAPSTLDTPQAQVVLSNGVVIQGKWLPKPVTPIIIVQPNGAGLVVKPDDFLTAKAGETPITQNGAIEGFFWVKLEEVKAADITNSVVKVTIRDSLDQMYSQDTPMSGKNLNLFSLP